MDPVKKESVVWGPQWCQNSNLSDTSDDREVWDCVEENPEDDDGLTLFKCPGCGARFLLACQVNTKVSKTKN